MNDLIIYNTPDGKNTITLYANGGSIWLNQKQIAESPESHKSLEIKRLKSEK
jgi:hypothetical protein